MRFPLTRPIARRRARALFDLTAGFVYSQVLLACVRLDLFARLLDAPRSAASLAAELDLDAEAARRLLDAATSLRLIERRRGDRFGLGPLGAALIGDPGIAAMIEHHPHFYDDLSDPVALLRGEVEPTSLGRYWRYAGASDPTTLSEEDVARYSALMATSQSLVAHQVLDAHPVAAHRTLLDVGGGEGAFVQAALERAPSLRGIVFDLPAVVSRARRRLDCAGLADRASVVGGDFLRDALPRGADLVSLVRILHDHDDAPALALLRSVRGVIADDGVLLVAEPMSETRGAETIGDAYFGLYLLAMGSGRPRTARRLREMIESAGFESVTMRPTSLPLQTRVITARPAR